mmetsp:Transcript_70130/g.182620  ORF Transcript_70130/g.182620 Transcript_70130/m.182620 type:complete len:271 (-) Transcript_70130:204-1016(-)
MPSEADLCGDLSVAVEVVDALEVQHVPVVHHRCHSPLQIEVARILILVLEPPASKHGVLEVGIASTANEDLLVLLTAIPLLPLGQCRTRSPHPRHPQAAQKVVDALHSYGYGQPELVLVGVFVLGLLRAPGHCRAHDTKVLATCSRPGRIGLRCCSSLAAIFSLIIGPSCGRDPRTRQRRQLGQSLWFLGFGFQELLELRIGAALQQIGLRPMSTPLLLQLLALLLQLRAPLGFLHFSDGLLPPPLHVFVDTRPPRSPLPIGRLFVEGMR